MNIISVSNIKGGTGKTCTAINLAAELAKEYSVLLIDNDPQSNVTQILLPEYNEFELSLYDVYSNKKIAITECIYQYDNNLYVVPNDLRSMKLDIELVSRTKRETILKGKLECLEELFDYVIIDNSPYLGLISQNALISADHIICVIDNSSSSLTGLRMLREVIRELYRDNLMKLKDVSGVIRNKFDRNTNFTKDLNKVVEEEIPDLLFNDIVYNYVVYKEATAIHKPIQYYCCNDKSEVYKALTAELLERIK